MALKTLLPALAEQPFSAIEITASPAMGLLLLRVMDLIVCPSSFAAERLIFATERTLRKEKLSSMVACAAEMLQSSPKLPLTAICWVGTEAVTLTPLAVLVKTA